MVGETDERLLVVTARHVVPRGFEPSPLRSSEVVHQGVPVEKLSTRVLKGTFLELASSKVVQQGIASINTGVN